MRERSQTSRRIVRFRYWSRKAYAAFASIGVCVTIGRLRKNVTEAALKKQQTPVTRVGTEVFVAENTPKETDISPTLAGWQQLLTQVLPQQKTEVAYAAEGNSFAAYHLLYMKRLFSPVAGGQPLFVCPPHPKHQSKYV